MTLVDTLVGMAILGIAVASLFGGISFGFATVSSTRNELRASQILIEKMETIRLYTWDQINKPGFIPNNFTAAYYPPNLGNTDAPGSGVTYSGTVSISAGPTGRTYSSELRKITIGLTWTSGNRTVKRSISTLVCRGGLQRYIY